MGKKVSTHKKAQMGTKGLTDRKNRSASTNTLAPMDTLALTDTKKVSTGTIDCRMTWDKATKTF